MKIKIIDLFNKIANNEEVPKKIRYFCQIYEYSENMKFYYQNGFSMYRDFFTEGNCLNDEVEIIEEDKKIEKLSIICDGFNDSYYDTCLVKIAQKVDEIIDAVNKLEESESNEK